MNHHVLGSIAAALRDRAQEASSEDASAATGVATSVGGFAELVRNSLQGLVQNLVDYAPRVLGMLVLVGVGWLVSSAARKVATLLFGRIGFDRAADKVGLSGALARANIKDSPSALVGKLVFWFFMLTFMVPAAESLGLNSVSQTLNAFVAYLPNVFAAVVLLVAGMMLANFVRTLVHGGAESIGLEFGGPLSRLVWGVMMIIVVSLSIGQLKIQTELVNGLIQIVFVATAGAMALALGLGTRDLAKQVVAGVYARDLYEPGVEMTILGERGHLIEIGAVTTVLERDDGERVYVPNDKLTEALVRASHAEAQARRGDGGAA